MRFRAVVDLSSAPRVLSDDRHPLWWGIIGLILIEVTVVTTFVVSYFFLRMSPGPWPPPGIEPPPHLWESVNVGLLVASAGAMWWAGRRIRKEDSRGLVIGLVTAVLLDALVLVFRWLQFGALDFGWDDHAYGSIVWTVTAFHFVHVASAILGTSVVAVLAARGFFNRERQLAVVVDTMYWYFVSFAWIPLYLTIYWSEGL